MRSDSRVRDARAPAHAGARARHHHPLHRRRATVVVLVALPLFFSSDIFFPATRLPEGCQAIATLLPLEPLAHGLRHAITAGSTRPTWPSSWALTGLATAIRRFDWLPAPTTAPRARPGGSARSGDEGATRDAAVRRTLISVADWQARLTPHVRQASFTCQARFTPCET